MRPRHSIYAEALRGHQIAVEEMKIPQREEYDYLPTEHAKHDLIWFGNPQHSWHSVPPKTSNTVKRPRQTDPIGLQG